jgi:hypothetical protein
MAQRDLDDSPACDRLVRARDLGRHHGLDEPGDLCAIGMPDLLREAAGQAGLLGSAPTTSTPPPRWKVF